MALTGTGLAIGLVLAAVATRWMKTMLYGVDAIDPATFAAVSWCCLGSRCWLAGFRLGGRRVWTRSWSCGKNSPSGVPPKDTLVCGYREDTGAVG